MMEPLVSVVIPCYNVSSYVERAIASILNQTYENLEVWIVDDASTDDTLQKIRAFDDKRICVFAMEVNTHKIGAVNEVLKKVKGDLIVFQDADDWSEPERISEQVRMFKMMPDVGICFTNARYFGKKGPTSNRIALSSDELKNVFFNFLMDTKGQTLMPVCATMMISKNVLRETKGYHPYFQGRVAEDIHWVYTILKAFPGISINKVLYNCNWRDDSFTGKQFKGTNAKYAYSWQLLSKIINKDMYDGVDLLDPVNKDELHAVELEACEQVLLESVKLVNTTRQDYESSMSFKIGSFLLAPIRLLKTLRRV